MKTKYGLTLIEVIFAVTLSAAVAVLAVSYLHRPASTASRRSCDLRREILQEQADRHTDLVGRAPSRDLAELRTAEYSGAELPTCPDTGDSYRFIRDQVSCPSHP